MSRASVPLAGFQDGPSLGDPRGTLYLRDPGKDGIYVYSLADSSAATRFVSLADGFPRSWRHLEWIFREKRPLICADSGGDQCAEVESSLLSEGIRSSSVRTFTTG